MEQEDLEVQEPCSSCGTVVGEGLSPVFAFGDGAMLCWKCAMRRGGQYDAEKDTWVVAPDINDLRPSP
jgi:hypothetical protein